MTIKINGKVYNDQKDQTVAKRMEFDFLARWSKFEDLYKTNDGEYYLVKVEYELGKNATPGDPTIVVLSNDEATMWAEEYFDGIDLKDESGGVWVQFDIHRLNEFCKERHLSPEKVTEDFNRFLSNPSLWYLYAKKHDGI